MIEKIGVQSEETIMIAAHGWDIAVALKAGMQADFIERKGQSLYPLAPQSTFLGKDLREVAAAIIEKQTEGYLALN